MNFSSITGIAIGCLVIWLGVITHTSRPAIFLDTHALILVIGGTTAAGLIAFPLRKFRDLFHFFWMGVIYPPKPVREKILEDIIRLSPTLVSGTSIPVVPPSDLSHPFLREGYRLIAKDFLDESDLLTILKQRSRYFKERYMSDAKMLVALAKFPPAFGLLGASTGMIAMMSGLGANSQNTIGPSMAIALVATFWGIAMANFILLPLSDHATKLATEDAQIRQMIITGLVLINRRVPPKVLVEYMLGYLPVNRRTDSKWRELREFAERQIGVMPKSNVVAINRPDYQAASGQSQNE